MRISVRFFMWIVCGFFAPVVCEGERNVCSNVLCIQHVIRSSVNVPLSSCRKVNQKLCVVVESDP